MTPAKLVQSATVTNIPTADPAASTTGHPPEPGIVTLAQAAGQGLGALTKASGGGAGLGGSVLGFMLAAMIGTVLWMNARVGQAEEAYKASVSALGAYDARLLKIELTLNEYADAAKELPEIRRSLERLVEDQRKAAGGIETLERLIKDKQQP